MLIADIGGATQIGSLFSGLVGTVLALLAFVTSRSNDKRKASKDELTATWEMQQDLNKTLNEEIQRLRNRVRDLEDQLHDVKAAYEAELVALRPPVRLPQPPVTDPPA